MKIPKKWTIVGAASVLGLGAAVAAVTSATALDLDRTDDVVPMQGIHVGDGPAPFTSAPSAPAVGSPTAPPSPQIGSPTAPPAVEPPAPAPVTPVQDSPASPVSAVSAGSADSAGSSD